MLITINVELKGLGILLHGTNKTIDDLSADDLLQECINLVQRLNHALLSKSNEVEALKYKLLDKCELFWRVCFHKNMNSQIESCVDHLYRKFLIVSKNTNIRLSWKNYLENLFEEKQENDLNEAIWKMLIREQLENYSRKWKGDWPCSTSR